MKSKRTIITISDQEKQWLTVYSEMNQISIAEAIRRGIASLKTSEGLMPYRKLINETKGIWNKGNGLKYQKRLRLEWESS